jgi:hypothetical protein
MAASAAEPKLPCPPRDLACAMRVMQTHPAKQEAFWAPALAKPVSQRIGAAPPELVELLAIDNVAHGYPNKPRAPRLTPRFLAEVRRAFDGIPEAVTRPLAAKLAGIYFVDDIGGTGFSDEVTHPGGRIGVVVLDPSVLMARTANQWATWKDNTPFRPDPEWKLEERIEAPAHDDRVAAIQYILLHEIGHVLSIGSDAHPPWTRPPSAADLAASYPFFALSWTVKGQGYVTRFDEAFPDRGNVAFYFGAKLDGKAMKRTYEALERTNFPTLYAMTHPGDDFAESLANYVHVVLMKKPFEIRISKGGTVVKTYVACWSEERCAAKRRYLEEFLRRR